jgi:hypothetical protein
MAKKYTKREPLSPMQLLKGFTKKELGGIEADCVSHYWLEQLFTEIPDLGKHVDTLSRMQANAEALGFTKVVVDISRDYDGDLEVDIYGWRPETKKEARARRESAKRRSEAATKAAKVRKKAKAKRERETYEKLHKKFGTKK